MDKRGLEKKFVLGFNEMMLLAFIYECDNLIFYGARIHSKIILNNYSKPRYPQPGSIHPNTGNELLDERLIEREHGRLKYKAKYANSKNFRRLPR